MDLTQLFTLLGLIAFAATLAGFMAGLFGIGGGAVLVPVFYQTFLFAGVSDSVATHVAIGTSLAIIVPTSLRSFQSHYKRGAVAMDILRIYLIAIPIGVLFGTLIIKSISASGLRMVFAAIVLLIAMRMLFKLDRLKLGDEIPKGPVPVVAGIVIGLLSTLMGIGGGVLNNTFMTLYGRPIHQAIATSSGAGVLISIPAMIGAIWAGWGNPDLPAYSTGYVNWLGVILVIPITLCVAPLGANFAHKLDKRKLELGFALFLLVVAARFIYSVL